MKVRNSQLLSALLAQQKSSGAALPRGPFIPGGSLKMPLYFF